MTGATRCSFCFGNLEILQMAERIPNLYFVIHETQKRWRPLSVFQTKLVREKIQRKRIRGAKEVVSPQEEVPTKCKLPRIISPFSNLWLSIILCVIKYS